MASVSSGRPRRIPGLSERRNGANPPRASSPPATPTGSAARAPFRRWWRFLLFPALLLANFLLIQLVTPGQPQRVEVSYTFFKQQVETDNVAQISTRADTIQGTFKQTAPYQPDVVVP